MNGVFKHRAFRLGGLWHFKLGALTCPLPLMSCRRRDALR